MTRHLGASFHPPISGIIPTFVGNALTPPLKEFTGGNVKGDDADGRPRVDGKFLCVGGRRFLIKGATYGTFAPDATGQQFPPPDRVAADLELMAEHGLNTVRTYTLPPTSLLDEAARHGMRVMAGVPWSQHVAFLDDRRMCREIRRTVTAQVREIAKHPALLMVALGNEIPSTVVRWHGRARIERFLSELYGDSKALAPETLFTYVNYPPTEYLDLPFLDPFYDYYFLASGNGPADAGTLQLTFYAEVL